MRAKKELIAEGEKILFKKLNDLDHLEEITLEWVEDVLNWEPYPKMAEALFDEAEASLRSKLEDILYCAADERAYQRDPMGYLGLSWSMFA